MRVPSLCLLAIIAIAGCKHAGDATISSHLASSKDLPKGWKRAASDSSQVSIGLPPGWLSKNMKASDLAGGDKSLPSDLEKAADEALSNGAIKLIAFHTLKKGSSFAMNANVVVIPDGGKSLDDLEKENVDQLHQMVSGKIDSSKMSLPAGDAVVVKYNRSIPTGNGSVDVDFVSYLLDKDGNQYILTFSTPPDEMSLKPQTVEMAKTFEIG
jgi:hypothetical protein